MVPDDDTDPRTGAASLRRPPRVLIATRIFTPEVAAASFRLRSLADTLARSGATVRVLTTRAPKSDGKEPATAGISVSRFPVLRDRSGSIRGYFQYLSFDIPLLFRLLFTRADVVVAEPPPTTGAVVALVSWIQRRPFVYYAADIWTDAVASTNAPRLVTSLMRSVEGLVLRSAHTVLAVSEDVADRVREFGATSVHTVGNGVDTAVFTQHPSPSAATARFDAAPRFVYAGTMSEWQGAEVFLEAFALLGDDAPTAQLHVLGQGSQLAAMTARAAEIAPTRIHFHGLVSATETASWLRGATAALVSITPGQGYDFAKPTKLYAAAACGTPVIFAGVGAASELVESAELGLAVQHSAPTVAAAMRQLIADQNSGLSAARSGTRAQWAQDNASLTAVGARATSTILSIATEHRKDGGA